MKTSWWSRNKDKRTPEQRAARAAYAREWRKLNPDKAKEHARKSMAKRDPEAKRAYQRKWLEDNADSHKRKSREWYASNKDRIRANNWRKNFGITPDDFARMLAEQNGACKICGAIEPGKGDHFAVDHNHETGAVRGLLCTHCNTGLGKFRDDPALLEKAATYLRSQPSLAP